MDREWLSMASDRRERLSSLRKELDELGPLSGSDPRFDDLHDQLWYEDNLEFLVSVIDELLPSQPSAKTDKED